MDLAGHCGGIHHRRIPHHYGRVINRVDMHEEENPGMWGGVQMVDVPIGSIETLYPKTSDVNGLSMGVALFGLFGFAWIRRKID